MLPQVSIESAGHGIDAEYARALPVAHEFDLARPVESLQTCMRFADTAFLLEFTGEDPKGWSYRAQAGVEGLKGVAVYAERLGEQPDQQFALDVLVPSYLDVVAADQPVVQRIAAIANNTLYAYRKLTIPIRAARRTAHASHILTLARTELLIPHFRPRGDAMSRLTDRERQCLSLAASGLAIKQIAAQMVISEKTVELYRARARDKLGARTTAQAVAMMIAGALGVESASVEGAKEGSDRRRPVDECNR